MSDGNLVRQALAGRAEAYEELVRRWAGRVVALCHAKVGRADLADDLAQETLLRAYRALASLADPERFGSWLHGIALRTCFDWLRSNHRTPIPFSALGPDFHPEEVLSRASSSGEAAVDREDERRELLAQVEALPDAYRQVVMLYYYQDITYRQIAALLGVSPATVNARLTRARALLRERLSHCRR
ncbi:MAG TPA: sigma-70 family RNA polymerase sigma factor [Gemmataceae bacterium]|jgi:RNA polymerase sigma-70 factor (ECF subfamily)|nr:sigma-70 family RNA polymerase sigma factor [Gemmataceae bacterium]